MERDLPISPWPEWKIIEKVGEGSFGRVYKAERSEHGYTFYSAIKVISIPSSSEELNTIRQETEDESSTREYFENVMEDCIKEIATMENFRGNSHIVSVEDFFVTEYLDEIGWDIYIRMEFLTSFASYCQGKSLDEEDVLKLGIDLARALEYCEKLNIIHRDIKPENIFVSRFGDYKLGDFGIARELERSMSSFSKKGTYAYMAPEMYRGDMYDGRVDICSLGLVLYRLMNHNRLPFLSVEKQLITYRDKENALTRRISGEELPLPCDATRPFGEVIVKACAYAPRERYATARELREALMRLQRRNEAATSEDEEERTLLYRPDARRLSRDEAWEGKDFRKKRFQREASPDRAPERQAAEELSAGEEKSSLAEKEASGRVLDRENGNGTRAEGRESHPSAIPGDPSDKNGMTLGQALREGVLTLEQAVAEGYLTHKEAKKYLSLQRDEEHKAHIRRQEAQGGSPAKKREETGASGARKAGPAGQKKTGRGFLLGKVMEPSVMVRILGGILGICLVLGVGGWFMKHLVEESVKEQTDRLVNALSEKGVAPAEDNTQDFNYSIELISGRATTIANQLSTYTQTGEEGSVVTYYNGDGELRKVKVYPDASDDHVTEEYYYWNDTMFFTYVYKNEKTEEMYYFRDGILLRWIDQKGTIHDDEQDNQEFTDRGDKYWRKSVSYLP